MGLIDSDIDPDHPIFDGKTVTRRFLGAEFNLNGNTFSHGTAVASVIAARPSETYVADLGAARGVAEGADIAVFALPPTGGGGGYSPYTPGLLGVLDELWASWLNAPLAWSSGGRSIDFLNLSVALDGIIEQYSEQDLRTHFGDAIAAMAQAGASEKTIFVWAAGNAHGEECNPEQFTATPELCVATVIDEETRHFLNARSVEITAGLMARISELRGHVIAVVAVSPDEDGDYEIAPFSNRCGIAADWCIAAPGQDVRVAYFGPDEDDNTPGDRGVVTGSGTSFAAPMVTGGLVVMKQVFRGQLSNTALVTRLLATANNGGPTYSDRHIYGHGLMDLGAATAPVGDLTLSLGELVDGPRRALADTRFQPGGAVGNALSRSLAGQEIAAFDELGAPFWYRLGALARAVPRRSAAARLRTLMASRQDGEPGLLRPGFSALAGGGGVRFGVLEAPAADAGGHLSLAGGALALTTAGRGGLGLTAFSTEGLRGRQPATGAALSWRPGGGRLGLSGGWVAERATALGSTTRGAFGRLSGASAFAGIEGSARIGAWRLGAGAEIGTVRAAPRGGMIAGVSPVATSALALAAERRTDGGGVLSVSLAQPLRVEAGRARMAVPVGRSKDGRVLRRALSAGLVPSGRQIDLAAEWRRGFAKAGELRLGGVWTRQPGHDAASGPELGLFGGWRYAF